jgi:MoxR-like ATPase
MRTNVSSAASSLHTAIGAAGKGLIERETLVELIALAAVAGEHLLVIGPPGTAKSEAVRRLARALDARYFEYLLGRFTEPSEIFGPVDLRKLKEGFVETETRGMLPEAEVAFLDEVFLGSTAILNTLLGILNERTFARGHTRQACPLRICVGASNALPHDEQLAAFADRFLVRIFLEPIADPRLEELLEGGWGLGSEPSAARVSMAELDELSGAARAVDLSAVRPLLAHALRLLRGAGVVLSDRRSVRVQRLIAAAGVLAGRTVCTAADLWPIIYAVPTVEGQRTARAALRELLEATANETLPAAAQEASQGPLARAARIAASGREILAARPSDGQAAELQVWSLKLEGIAREIDAGFVGDAVPPDLREIRTRIVEIMGAR